jgi:enoyl-CoA hydratase/carnithine racemase
MADTAYLKQSNASYGLPLPASGSFLLPQLVGLAQALEIARLDEPIAASRVLELSLMTRVVPHAALMVKAQGLVARMLIRRMRRL